MSTSLVAIIIGSGPNVGQAVATKLKANGYLVAIGSRNPDIQKLKKDGFFPVTVDVTKADSINEAFATINKELGIPNVVVYNPGVYYPLPNPTDPLSLPQDTHLEALHIASGTFISAQQALKGFRSEVHSDHPKVFINNGNMLHVLPPTNPTYLSLGQQKVLEAYYMNMFSKVYANEGIRFHYAHLVGSDGLIPPYDETGFKSSGPAHADAYWDLITRTETEEWDYRFTMDGKKYSNYKSA